MGIHDKSIRTISLRINIRKKGLFQMSYHCFYTQNGHRAELQSFILGYAELPQSELNTGLHRKHMLPHSFSQARTMQVQKERPDWCLTKNKSSDYTEPTAGFE